MNEKYIERYQQLIRVLRELSPHEKRKHFDMTHWGQLTPCGTSCCAAGFAAMDPWFRKLGLTIQFDLDDEGIPSKHATLKYKNLRDWKALRACFGPSVVNGLFSPDDSVFQGPRSVGGVIKAAEKRIRELRKEKAKKPV